MTDPTRVLHVINQLGDHGGAETSLRQLLHATHGRLVEHALCVLDGAHSQLTDLEAIGVRTFTAHAGSRWHHQYRVVSDAIRRFQPSLVHSTLFQANFVARIAARRNRVPVLMSVVSTPYARSARIDSGVPAWKFVAVRAADRHLARRWTTHVHAISQTTAAAADRDLGVAPEIITVVPRGRDMALYPRATEERRRTARQMLGVAPTARVIVAIGREEPPKGLAYLYDAVSVIRSTDTNVTLLHAGRTGAQSGRIERQLASNSELQACVRRLGVRTDVAEILTCADVFVMPSLVEGLGGAAIEAMAIGVPIVAADSPALREVLDDGRCGVLVPIADSEALARAIVDVLADSERAELLTRNATSRFDNHYALPAVANDMIRLWHSVAKTNRG